MKIKILARFKIAFFLLFLILLFFSFSSQKVLAACDDPGCYVTASGNCCMGEGIGTTCHGSPGTGYELFTPVADSNCNGGSGCGSGMVCFWYTDWSAICGNCCGGGGGSDPKGELESATCELIKGWTCDESDYSRSLNTHTYDNGAAVFARMAEVTRETAICDQCGGYCNHGLTIPTPASMIDDQTHLIKVYAINIGTGSNRGLSYDYTIGPCNSHPQVISLTPDTETLSGAETKTFTTVFGDANTDPANNILANGSFEAGTEAWRFGQIQRQIMSSPVTSKFGTKYLQVSQPCPSCPKDPGLGAGDYSVLQDIPISDKAAGTSFKLSAYMKSATPAQATLVWWEMGGAYGGEAHYITFNIDQTWKRYEVAGTLNRSDRTLLRAQVYLETASVNYDLDGILLEQGATKGIFTDVEMFQFNLEQEDDQTYTSSLWPLRLIFAKKRPGYLLDSFQIGLGDSYTSRQATYDAGNDRWYLGGNNITLSNGITILTGADNTFFTINAFGQVVAQWKVSFPQNFPDGTYNMTLYSEDMVDAQDETGDLYLNSTWYFHRLGTLTKSSTGTITGQVFDNPNCQCSGAANSTAGWSVTCNGSTASIAGNNYTCPGTYTAGIPATLILTPTAGWNCASCGTYSCSQQITVVAGANTAPSFYQCQPAEPWWQTIGGNIHSQKEVRSNVPNGQDLISGTNAIVSYVTDLNIFDGSVSTAGWSAQSEYDGPDYTYDWWVRQLKDEDKGTGSATLGPSYHHDGVYELNGNSLSGSLPSGRKVVILVDDNLNIDADIDVAVGSFLMVISSGTITVANGVDGSLVNPGLEGIFIADKIHFGSGDVHLFAAGNFISWSSDDDAIEISRNIGEEESITTPSVTFISRPDLLLNAPDFVRKIDFNWQQVPG